MRRAEAFDSLAEWTWGQWGLFTRAQAVSAGVSDQDLEAYLRTGDLERVRRGVYRFRRDRRHPLEPFRAAWLQIDPSRSVYERVSGESAPDAVFSHTSAAYLQDLGLVFSEGYHFTTGVPRRTRHHDVEFHVASLDDDEWELVDGLPVTTPIRIVHDLLASHRDLDHVQSVIADAISGGRIDADDLDRVRSFADSYGISDDLLLTELADV